MFDYFSEFLISILKVYKLVEDIKSKGGTITREPGPVKGGSSVIAFAKDPDGYLFELIQRGPTPEPLCQVMLRVGDLDRAIKFYEKVNPYSFLIFTNGDYLMKQYLKNRTIVFLSSLHGQFYIKPELLVYLYYLMPFSSVCF